MLAALLLLLLLFRTRLMLAAWLLLLFLFRTPLMLAAWKGHVEQLQFLIDSHADVNAVDVYGRTALHAAV